jgi:hypothetical protein
MVSLSGCRAETKNTEAEKQTIRSEQEKKARKNLTFPGIGAD